MPLYEFQCKCSGKLLITRLCSYSERAAQVCKHCHKLLEPVISVSVGKVEGGTPKFTINTKRDKNVM